MQWILYHLHSLKLDHFLQNAVAQMVEAGYIAYHLKVYSFCKQVKLQWFLVDLKSVLILKRVIKCDG